MRFAMSTKCIDDEGGGPVMIIKTCGAWKIGAEAPNGTVRPYRRLVG